MADIRFDNQVAVVTGAGGGLGRQHALGLAARGAMVVVNDLGGAVDGTGAGSEAARKVVEEIRAAGGQAIADGASVTDEAGLKAMAERAVAEWGRIDILVANAGILRDRSFSKMEMADFQAVLDVHLMGTVKAAKAVWEVMRAQNYGRIIMTTSPTGLFGNFGQSNYGAAKLGVVGFMNSLKLEGEKHNIRVNTIHPVAATRMTEHLLPPPLLAALKPEYVTTGVLYLASSEAPSGCVLTAAGGAFALVRIMETEGVFLGPTPSPEAVRDNWERIADPDGQRAYQNGGEQTAKVFRMLNLS